MSVKLAATGNAPSRLKPVPLRSRAYLVLTLRGRAAEQIMWESSRRYVPRCRAANWVHDSSPVVMLIP